MLALVLSIVPGVGQIYRGKPLRGILWFCGVMLALSAAPPLGLLIWIICAANAAFSDALREGMPVR
ncbi:MAG: hypothetical protein WA993_14430 [Candidatus Binatus sp.]|uniref:hypothetical protein n=1 Tax=Candidatus Binatus sp. TaxID=2811406 RepID=UPI003CB496CF